MAMASAQPISLPFWFQPGRSLQARHRSPRTMPRPMDELASEKPLTSLMMRSPGMVRKRKGRVRTSRHHARSSLRALGACLGVKGRSWKVPIIFSKIVRYALPCGMMWHVYSSFPYSLRVSSSVYEDFCFHSSIARMYFIFLVSGRDTVLAERFHAKPAKITVVLNGTSFVASQGMPRGIVTSSISSKL